MSEALNEAIQAVLDTGLPMHQADIHVVLRAVPDGSLIELALERGCLVDTGHRLDGWSVYRIGDTED